MYIVYSPLQRIFGRDDWELRRRKRRRKKRRRAHQIQSEGAGAGAGARITKLIEAQERAQSCTVTKRTSH